jgi:hypothetical protein
MSSMAPKQSGGVNGNRIFLLFFLAGPRRRVRIRTIRTGEREKRGAGMSHVGIDKC